ncbi:hypothetical protein HVA01_25540 [Halovibrio variabilis]|uniref:Uncharacterized protein n=1 Tax=Halovibrio variabilis TaxID=31910 RepID=A0A511UT75_9GAMM|nr:hypothetical protein HVA01_25540 [Halovibrio variabilis]
MGGGSFNTQRLSAGVSGREGGTRYRHAQNDDRLSGYGLVNLRAGWQFAPLWSARVTLDNTLDQDYITTRSFDGADYLNAGRAGFLSVHFGQ